MAKSINWRFEAPDKIVYSGEASKVKERFSFILTRYKDADTHEESLKIASLLSGADNGFIMTSIVTLESDIKQLMRYGVVLSALDFRELRIAIENNYLELSVTAISLDEDTRFDDLLEQTAAFVNGDSNLNGGDFCFVSVSDFNDLTEDCGYNAYEMKALRASLFKGGYIRKQGDRYTVIERISGKPQRVIAFYRTKLITSNKGAIDEK